MNSARGFKEKLNAAWENNNSLVCVGLDPNPNLIPKHLNDFEFPIFEFNKRIIDATFDVVCAYKPQIAYYSAAGAEDQLLLTMNYLNQKCPHIPVILDAKRNDIGSTAAQYAMEAFERYQADAVTVSPYMGGDSLAPFLNYKDKGIIILCRTSNPGASDIQDLIVDDQPLYQKLARMAVNEWNYNKNILFVLGATSPDQIKEVREIAPDITFLVPGIGAQGGDVEKTVRNGLNPLGTGLIINSSRGIIYAGVDENFCADARNAAIALRDIINHYR